MIESLRKKAEEFAVKEASQRATEEMMKVIKPYVEGEMRKQEVEFQKMAKYINSLELRVEQLEKAKEKTGELQGTNSPRPM
jgi:septum formation topological specificity factor MinE